MYTVVGCDGFIGSRVCEWLVARGHHVDARRRLDPGGEPPYGRLLWCAGVTGDFRTRPLETVRAHVVDLLPALAAPGIEALVYLSSTRLYQHAVSGQETSDLTISADSPPDLYNASKILGEALCLASISSNARVARLANVYGTDGDSPDVITSLARAAVGSGSVELHSPRSYAKDYVHIEDVVPVLVALADQAAAGAGEPIYNIASGMNTSNGELAGWLEQLTGCRVESIESGPTEGFPRSQLSAHDAIWRSHHDRWRNRSAPSSTPYAVLCGHWTGKRREVHDRHSVL